MDYPVNFSGQLKAHLRSLRKAKGLTQARLGQMLGMPQPRIAELEANPGAISVDTLFKVLSVLDALMLLRDKVRSDATSRAENPTPTSPTMGQRNTNPSKPKGSW